MSLFRTKRNVRYREVPVLKIGSLSNGVFERRTEVDFLRHWAVVWFKLSCKSS